MFQDGSIERRNDAPRRQDAGGRRASRRTGAGDTRASAADGRPLSGRSCRGAGPRRAGAGDSLEGIRRRHARRSSASLPTVSGTCHSLSKVLFTFPSRYLFAIGLSCVFSLGWDSPPDWDCTPKQPDSPEPPRAAGAAEATGLSPSRMPPLSGLRLRAPQRTALHATTRPEAIPGVGSARFARRYSGHPRSFLFLRLVICLSSAGGLVDRQVN